MFWSGLEILLEAVFNCEKFRQSKTNLYKEKHSYKSKHNKVQTINDTNFKNRTPKIMSFCQNYYKFFFDCRNTDI
jgi:hypothetical protein